MALASIGRLRYWDEGRVVSGYDGVWASRYRKEHGQAWHEIYVGNHGFMPDKREWPGVLGCVEVNQLRHRADAA